MLRKVLACSFYPVVTVVGYLSVHYMHCTRTHPRLRCSLFSASIARLHSGTELPPLIQLGSLLLSGYWFMHLIVSPIPSLPVPSTHPPYHHPQCMSVPRLVPLLLLLSLFLLHPLAAGLRGPSRRSAPHQDSGERDSHIHWLPQQWIRPGSVRAATTHNRSVPILGLLGSLILLLS